MKCAACVSCSHDQVDGDSGVALVAIVNAQRPRRRSLPSTWTVRHSSVLRTTIWQPVTALPSSLA